MSAPAAGPFAAQVLPAHASLGAGTTTDLASRVLGGGVVACSDEFFAPASSLVLAHPAGHDPSAYDGRGKVYDGWETRRRRRPSDAGVPDHDWAVVRLGAVGTVDRVDVDTAWFRGNYPPRASVEGVWLPGHPGPDDLAALPEGAWTPLAPVSDLAGDAVTTIDVTPAAREVRVSHVRLRIFPDGGVARLRVHGRVVPDPALLTGTVDLLAAELGGAVLAASDEFYTTAAHLLVPGRAATTADGWENARRRDGGHDWVLFALAAAGAPRRLELDTGCFVGNAPARVRVLAADARAAGGDGLAWRELLDVRPQPDTRHLLPLAAGPALTHLLLQVHPDGGLSRLRLWGELDDAARASAQRRWDATSR